MAEIPLRQNSYRLPGNTGIGRRRDLVMWGRQRGINKTTGLH